MSDDLTSWHLSATAVSASLQAGSGDIAIPVRLPFFVEAGLAPEYLVGDKPAVRVRAFGSALKTGDPVAFTISSTTLPMAATTVHGTAFQPIDVPLPVLHLGDQTLTIGTVAGSGSATRTDTLIRHFTVVASRLLKTQTAYAEVASGLVPPHGDGLTTYVFSDAGRGRFLAFLEGAAASDGARLDQALGRAVARDLVARYFPTAVDAGSGAGDTVAFDPNQYTSADGLSLLPYSGSDLELTADAALIAPDRFRAPDLRDSFQRVLDDPESTRERRIIALAGRAGLGDPVLVDVRSAAAATDLTPIEQLYLGLASAALGDDVTALRMESGLLSLYGGRQGPWLRLAIGSTPDETIHGTALLEMLAADVGDPIASAADAYVASHPTTESVPQLIQLGYVQAAIGHASSAPASFAVTVDGVRKVTNLAAGDALRLVLTANQAASMSVEPLSGKVGLASSWEAPIDLAATPVDPAVTITRTWSPSGDLPASAVAAVTITLDFHGSLGQNECYEVTDLAPSGLAPVARLADWQIDDNGNRIVPDVVDPYAIEGQRVRFCAAPPSNMTTATLRYYLRVVTTGTYVWEPAIASSSITAAGVSRTEAATIVVK